MGDRLHYCAKAAAGQPGVSAARIKASHPTLGGHRLVTLPRGAAVCPYCGERFA